MHDVLLLKEGLFTTEGGKAALLLGHCKDCDTSFFPNRPFCSRCSSDNIEEVTASKGKLYSFTTVIHPSPESRMPTPYGMAKVDFPDRKIRITGLCTESDTGKLKRGQDVDVVVNNVYEEEGRDVVMYQFQPVEEGK